MDSFALLAYLGGESGAQIVRTVLEYGQAHKGSLFLSVINLGECMYIIEGEQGLEAAHKALAAMMQLPIEIVLADYDRTLAAAHVKANHKLSFADAFAIALAREKQATVITGDPEFEQAKHLISIEWLPK
ncbi:MAG: type II toxin-antitoxin system VapC family toxin [Verrucomicrobia bacterium]|nr:type II toxin-antitoxin system VapC family toxin [Verrucomicrobiota bacterium]